MSLLKKGFWGFIIFVLILIIRCLLFFFNIYYKLLYICILRVTFMFHPNFLSPDTLFYKETSVHQNTGKAKNNTLSLANAV